MVKNIAIYTHKIRMLVSLVNKEKLFMTGYLFESIEEFDKWCEAEGGGFKETVQQVRLSDSDQGQELETALNTFDEVGYKDPATLEAWKERFVDRLDRSTHSDYRAPFLLNEDGSAIIGAVITFQLELSNMTGVGFIAGLPSDCFDEEGENLGEVYGALDSHEGTLNALGVPGLEV